MILAIDTGNTHTVIGCIDMNGEIVHIMRIQSNPYKTEHEYAADMKLILELNGVNLRRIEGAVISSSNVFFISQRSQARLSRGRSQVLRSSEQQRPSPCCLVWRG